MSCIYTRFSWNLPMELHTSVLLKETLQSLNIKSGDMICDCTAGAGGHTSEFLKLSDPQGLVVALDQDPLAISIIRERFSAQIKNGNLYVTLGNFAKFSEILMNLPIQNRLFDAIFADIGVSSMQIDRAERGFSFQRNGPLDMKMGLPDPDKEYQNAYDFVNFADESLLAHVFQNFGEEPLAKKYARRICEYRNSSPFESTLQLADFIKKCSPYFDSKKHPATKVFQAIRIFINDELGALKSLIGQSLDFLKPGGRLGIITFHSLEDRIVKELYLELSGKQSAQNLPREIPLTHQELQVNSSSKGSILKPFPIKPSEEEIATNPRSRSAKLRVFIKS